MKINTFLIGAQKAGTTSLYNWLDQHSNVYGPDTAKDFHYFSDDLAIKQGPHLLHNFYNNFSGQDIVLTAAVNYIFIKETAERIYKYNPNAKIIAVLREPVKRAISAYDYQKRSGNETKDINEVIALELQSKTKPTQANAHGLYLQHGLYYEQLTPYYKCFPKEQIKVLLFEELMADKPSTVSSVFNFLKIDANCEVTFEYLNKGSDSRFKFINNFLFSKKNKNLRKNIKKYLFLDRIINQETRIKLSNKVMQKNSKTGKTTEISSVYVKDIQAYLESDILALSKLIDKDLNKIWYSNGQ